MNAVWTVTLFALLLHIEPSLARNNRFPNAANKSGITDDELIQLSNRLYSMDENGAKGIVLNLQGQTTAGNREDKAPAPLFTSIPAISTRPTYAALLKLYDNYKPGVEIPEEVTAEEILEESQFLDAVLSTKIMNETHRFLISKGKADPNVQKFKEYLKKVWFNLYQRSNGIFGSSGFEHVFLGEWKHGISGLHSWIRYQQEEAKGAMNYLGYIKTAKAGHVTVIELPMKWNGVYKPVSSIAIGGSPELEMALYTVCFLARPDAACPVQGNGVAYHIQSHTLKHDGKIYIGSIYPIL